MHFATRSSDWFNRGVVIAFGLAAGLMLFLIVKSLFLPAVVAGLADAFLADEPLKPPPVAMKIEDRDALRQRVDDYVDRVSEGALYELATLTLDSDDLNVLIQDGMDEDDDWAAYVTIRNGGIMADLSYYLDPAETTGAYRELAGRYVRGKANLDLRLDDGRLIAAVSAIQVKGRDVPQWLFNRLLSEHSVFDLSESEDIARFSSNLDSLEIIGDRIVLTALPPLRTASEGERE